MIPKRFLVDDLGYRVGCLGADLEALRKRLVITQRQIDSQKKAIEALRKRISRQAAKARRASNDGPRWRACSPPISAPSPHP